MIRRPFSVAGMAKAAVRIGAGDQPVWISGPVDGSQERAPQGIGWHVMACDPVQVVRGDDMQAVQDLWDVWRQRWGCEAAQMPIAVGCLCYEAGAAWVGAVPARDGGSGGAWPTIDFRFYDALWMCDALGGAGHIVAVDVNAADGLEQKLLTEALVGLPDAVCGAWRGTQSDQAHIDGVNAVLRYLAAGDVYQVNLARTIEVQMQSASGPAGLALALRLWQQSPAPFGLWMAGPGDRFLLGNSPERFLQLGPDGLLSTSPIKGTRPRGPDDEALRAGLLASDKDRAEHDMIVDLQRNDLGRVCETGSVRVSTHRQIVSLPTVHHLVSTVVGRPRPGLGLSDILAATFPCGSITGAPKRRAMQIIRQLEPDARGPYTGATGWLGAAGDFDLAVAIRTAVGEGNGMRLGVGGGIVIESTPEDELAETNAKAAAFVNL